MKKLFTTLFVFGALMSNAQNVVNYGMLGNTTNIISNPSADPLTSFHFGYAQFYQDLNFGLTAGDLFAGSDGILGNLSALDQGSFSISNELHIDALSLGLKLGKNYIYAGTQIDLWTSLAVDLDMMRFAYSGMADAQGDFDPNYVGDFSDFGFSQDVIGTAYIGFQRSFLDNRLRIGAAFNQHRYYAGARMVVNELSLSSTPATNGLVELDAGLDIDIITSNILKQEDITQLSIDELTSKVIHLNSNGDPEIKIQDFVTTPMAVSNSYNFGITARPIKMLELSFNMNGFGGSGFTALGDAQHKLKESKNIGGFSYTSQPGDTIADEINNAIAEYIDELDSLNTTLTNQSLVTGYDVVLPQTIQGAMNCYFGKRSYVGAHYISRTNSVRDYDYLGFNAFWWCFKSLQVKAGYYTALDEMNSDFLNLALQFRLTPIIQVFVGTRSVMDFATIGDELMASDVNLGALAPTDLVVPSDFSNVHLTAGASLALFDKRFKEEKDGRKDAKAEKKANEVKTLTPAEEIVE